MKAVLKPKARPMLDLEYLEWVRQPQPRIKKRSYIMEADKTLKAYRTKRNKKNKISTKSRRRNSRKVK